MDDAICPRCGGDNLTDYPVCDTCATVAHFPYRTRCLHCERKHAAAMQENQMLELIQALADTWTNDCQFIPCDTEAAYAIGSKLQGLAGRATALLATMEEEK